jgi:ATP-dependent DNA ligase
VGSSNVCSWPFASFQASHWIVSNRGISHEIKYDGYRMMLIREQDRVRLISRGGHDFWARYFPLIAAGALELRQKHFVLDGEVVVLDKDGVSDFNALASRKHDKRAQLYAFDMLIGDGESTAALASQGQPCSAALAPGRWHFPRRL